MKRVELRNKSLSCPLCGEGGYKNLMGHILRQHNMTTEEFRKQANYEGPLVAPWHARLMAAKSNLLWQDPAIHAQRVETVRLSYTEELREKRRQDRSEQWQDPDIRAARSAGVIRLRAGEDKEVRRSVLRAAHRHQRSPFTILREELYERAGGKCETCGISEEDNLVASGRRLHLHHRNYDRIVPLLEDVELLCGSCHRKYHNNVNTKDKLSEVSKQVGNLLLSLGVDLSDSNFLETPRRFASYLLEHFADGGLFEQDLEDFHEAAFPSNYDGMIVQEFSANGICPHHLLPVLYRGAVAYAPIDVTVGLSKLTRISQQCLKYPVLQEMGTLLVADALEEVTMTPHVAVVLRGQHLCMTIRGVRAHDSTTTTSELRGDFYSNRSTRSEFMSLVHNILAV